jgi:glycerate-2-kinase
MRSDLLRIFAAAIASVAPERVIERAFDGAASPEVHAAIEQSSRIYLLAVGKAALGMAVAARNRLGSKIHESLVVVPAPFDPSSNPSSETLRVMAAAHPLPDASSVTAGRAALDFVGRACAGDLVLLLLSGGASALMTAPASAIQLADKIALSSTLMRAGASIGELNTVRKHLSAVKGGGLLRALNPEAKMLSLILSDVPGNDLSTIGSGPTVGDPTTFADAIAVLKRRKLWGRAPEAVRDRFERGAAGEILETVKRGDPALSRSISVVVGDNAIALDAAAEAANAVGYAVERWSDLSGPAERICPALAARLSELDQSRVCVIVGGEPLVTVRGNGRGGRAQHCALTLAVALARRAPNFEICAMFAGTDGVDGPTDAAGAIVTSTTVRRAQEARLDPQAALERSDSYSFFQSLGDLIITGPTGTNVMDIFVGLVNPAPG